MKGMRNEAAKLALLHDIGAIASDEVIRWADSLIESQDQPSQDLIELATAPEGKIGDELHRLALGSDTWRPVEQALPEILRFITAHPGKAPIVARAFYHIAVSQGYQVPDRLRFILSAEDDFDLATSGIYHLDEVYGWFIESLREAIKDEDGA